jgi:hypothetical protein
LHKKKKRTVKMSSAMFVGKNEAHKARYGTFLLLAFA